ncbi:RagB/SusD family nutrient uptake outer membrane protein [Bacteroides sp. K03]|uniref:RagB/SusD family nutrient uptake outer membrane protein n=1 Tax=Bacteroides sp. K03 TaxID=2718928 RepID=UPI001C8BEC56|nr:RagB/SusD family nutrient uptake outer membrane protein [Bacteroides sp. K03]MBX9186818.1 RagB/SusD family nutrient uptake outer membrane protein [Bacteroides sp. K03]
MKKNRNLLITILVVLASGCSDMLDIKPTTFISDEAIWEDKNLINQFVANTYGSMLCGFNRCTAGYEQDWSMSWAGNLDAATDDFASVSDGPIYTQLNKDAITAQSCPFVEEIWNQEYKVIRKCNIIIERAPGVDERILSAAEKKRVEAEARFLRAFCHFELARTFGKAPLIVKAQSLTDELQVAPSSFADIVKFVKEECDLYADNLPLSYSDDEAGHATKGAFLALKSRALLYLASPLNSADDSRKWADAAQAAQDVMDLDIYKLYKLTDTPYRSMAFDKTAANKETIFERRFTFPEAPHNIHMMWSLDAVDAGSWNGLYPTQNLVDAYETVNGKLTTDPTNTMYNTQDPYTNRDARFYQSIIYNGSIWETHRMSMVTNTVDPSKNGSCKPQLGKARCGYGPKKFIEELDPSTNLYGGYAQSNNWPYIRYAEVLLNYAEAKNEELAAPDPSVYLAINEVRSRSGQPDLPSGLSKIEMRERIKNERRIELLLEEHRFYDLRRWKDGDVLAEPIMGMNIYDDNVTLRYEVSKVEDRIFNGTHYYLPIPLKEQEKNPLLKD